MLKALRALTLLFALGIGLLGQVAVATALPMVMHTPEHMAAGSLVSGSGDCPACPNDRDLPGSPARMPGCAMAFCSILPAVMPPGLFVRAFARATFPLLAHRNPTGVTVRPYLGPPRRLHLA